ncbi:hypothetical protein N8512_00430 [Akkermansiaceae bacterium]|nr:hypothetical protein [Akkermansiaceae bacterium]
MVVLKYLLLLASFLPLIYLDTGYVFIYIIVVLIMTLTRHLYIFTVFYCLGTLYYYVNFLSTGSYFLGGGDDELFYDLSLQYANGEKLSDIKVYSYTYLTSAPYLGYILIQGVFFKVFVLMGLAPTPFWILIFKSVTSVFSFGVLMQSFCEKFRINYDFAIQKLIWFPGVLVTSVFGLRESIALLICMGIFALSKKLNFFRIVIIAASTFGLYYVRRNAVILAIYYLIPLFVRRLSRGLILKITLVFCFVIPIAYVLTKLELGERYLELSIDSSAKNSLGLLLYSTNLLFPLQVLYTYLSPIPPLFLKNPNVFNFVVMVGDFIKYYYSGIFLLLAFLKWQDLDKKHGLRSLLSGFFMMLLIVCLTSRDPRHLSFLMPLALLISINCSNLLGRQFLLRYNAIFFVGMTSMVAFFILR